MTNKCTTISQIITLLHVSTLSCHPQELVINALRSYTRISRAGIGNTVYNWDIIWFQAPWGWRDGVEICRSVTICEIIVHLLIIVQNNEDARYMYLKNIKIIQDLYFHKLRTNYSNWWHVNFLICNSFVSLNPKLRLYESWDVSFVQSRALEFRNSCPKTNENFTLTCLWHITWQSCKSNICFTLP